MRNPTPRQAVMNRSIGEHVAERSMDREAQIRKQTFLLLDHFTKRHDYSALIEMNGERCAWRQIFDLRSYDWQRKAA